MTEGTEYSDVTREIIELSKELIRFESVKGRSEELRRCVDFIKEYFADTDLVVKEVERNEKPSLLIGFEDTLTPQVVMMGHLDVIEANPEQFEAFEKDGKLYGRGTYDMKLQDAVCMVLMKRLAKSGNRRDIILGLTTDEEIGGKDGAQYLAQLGLRAEIAFAPDAGEEMNIVNRQKGIFHVKVKYSGKACHGSRLWLGDNAIEKAVEDIPKIKALFPQTTPEDRWKPTCNIGIIKGGDATNKVADWCEVSLDIRFTQDTTTGEILESIKGVSLGEVEVIAEGAYVETADDNPWLEKFRECAEKVLGKPLELMGSHGASDLRHLADVGIPGFLSHVPGSGAHGPVEYIEIDKIEPFFHILEMWVTEHVRDLDA